MEYKELKNKSEQELQSTLAQLRDKLRDLRFRDASRQLKNVREIRKTRQNIAQVLQLLTAKRLPAKSAEKADK